MSIFNHLPARRPRPETPEGEPDPDPVEPSGEDTGDFAAPAADLTSQSSTTTARAAGERALNKTAERNFTPNSQQDPRALADRIFNLRGPTPLKDRRFKPDTPKKPSKPPRD